MIRRIIVALIANAGGLLAAAYVIDGFNLDLNGNDKLIAFAALVGVFTFVTVIVRPIIKLVLTPIILLTFGLFNLVITGGLLYIVDKYAQNLTITGLPALIYGTIVITVINVIFHVGEHVTRKD